MGTGKEKGIWNKLQKIIESIEPEVKSLQFVTSFFSVDLHISYQFVVFGHILAANDAIFMELEPFAMGLFGHYLLHDDNKDA